VEWIDLRAAPRRRSRRHHAPQLADSSSTHITVDDTRGDDDEGHDESNKRRWLRLAPLCRHADSFFKARFGIDWLCFLNTVDKGC
jgi:hypothetical protein